MIEGIVDAWAALERDDTRPLFPVEEPGKPGLDPRLWPELERQRAFIGFLRKTQPKIKAFAIPNAGKRGFKAQAQAKAEGLLAGVFDVFVYWSAADSDQPATAAWIEWKGFDARGRPGKLSQAQIEHGNDLHRRGHKAACFYTVQAALDWLASLGAPVRGRIA